MTVLDFSQLIGAAGLICVTLGILIKERKKQDVFFIVGGSLLEIYSIIIKNPIFSILQLIFTLAAVYDLLRLKKII